MADMIDSTGIAAFIKADMIDSTAMVTDAGIFDETITLIIAVRTELFCFCLAFLLHQLLFGSAFRRGKKRDFEGRSAPLRGTGLSFRAPPGLGEADMPPGGGSPKNTEQALHWSQQAFDRNDHRAVLRLWTSLRQKDEVSMIYLIQAVETMQRLKKDSSSILEEIQFYFDRNKSDRHITCINQLLEMVTKSLHTELVNGVLELTKSFDMKANNHTYELLIQMQFSMRDFKEVSKLSSQMRAEKLAPTTKTSLVLLKVALQASNLDEALMHFKELSQESVVSTASQAPQHIMSQLVELACRERRIDVVLAEVGGSRIPLTVAMVNAMLAESIRLEDPSIAKHVKELVVSQKVELNSRSYQHFIRGAGDDRVAISDLLSEMSQNGVECIQEVVTSVLSVCTRCEDIALADQLGKVLCAHVPCNIPLLLPMVRFYADAGQPSSACALYDKHLKVWMEASNERRRTALDSKTEKCLIGAAVQCGRKDIASDLVGCSSADTAKHINLIRKSASKGDLAEALSIFESLEGAGADLTPSLYNSLLDACVECRDMKQAELLMKRMLAGGVVDAVSYNTLIKAHLREGNYREARNVVDTMSKGGCMPNAVTYNELINALVRGDDEAQRSQVWDVVEEMKSNGVRPNKVTCSILFRCLKARSSMSEVVRTMELTDRMEEPMDEVLLSSIIEACVRVGKPGLLTQKLEQLQGENGITVTGAHTFGSLIKAYGTAHDMDGAWRCWKAMHTQHVKPTSITIGCMVEAVVSNGDVDGAYELLTSLLEDEKSRGQVNAIVFGSVLKGYGRSKRMDRVWAVFKEMTTHGIQPSVATFNAIIDSCIRNNQIAAVDGLLADMKARGLQPSLITYSTVIKGVCQKGDMDAAFSVLKDLKASGGVKPDEIVYNTMLDGCATAGLVTQGEQLLEDMKRDGLAPTNYTLTVLVRLMGQAHCISKAFDLIESFASKHRVRANSYVYTALVQGCLNCRELSRATEAFQQAVRNRAQPEQRVCQSLLRALITSGKAQTAVSLLRSLTKGGSSLDDACISDIVGCLLDSAEAAAMAPPLVADIRSARPKLRLDSSIDRRLALAVAKQHSANEGSAPMKKHPWRQ